MRLLIVCSEKGERREKKPYTVTYDDHYARRLLMNLRDEQGLCTGCGDKCVDCRLAYDLDFSSSIAGVVRVPAELLFYLERPEGHLPDELPEHELTLAVGIHEDILLALPPLVKAAGARAILVPQEDPGWLSEGARNQMRERCRELGLEVAFPKPFCSLAQGEGEVIDEFLRKFRMGRPKLELELSGERIARAKVLRGAPCGATYYLAKHLEGADVRDRERLREIAAKYWHSFPCTASMKMDFELGDTILHLGGHIHYEAVQEAAAIFFAARALELSATTKAESKGKNSGG
ncbi:MAG: DUF166 domain-containing protein [Nitrospinota bacterium]